MFTPNYFKSLGNALKFTRKGKITVAVSLLSEDEEKDLKFAITDTGIGIAEDELEYILKTFNKQQICLKNIWRHRIRTWNL
jgi:K+-sensing histidine kinase KdpD